MPLRISSTGEDSPITIKPRRNDPGKFTRNGACLECEKPRKARGRCTPHYNALLRSERLSRGEICLTEGCEKPWESRGYCASHYQTERSRGELTGRKNSRGAPIGEWGNEHSTGRGYVRVKRRNADGTEDFMDVHRLVMETHLGRKLTAEESVDHKNGVRDDNRLANLELWSRYQPAGQRVEDKVAWAKEVLALYEPDALR